MIRRSFAASLIALSTFALPGAGTAQDAPRKYAGRLFDPLPAQLPPIGPDSPLPFAETTPDAIHTTPDAQPPIQVKVLLSPNAAAPQALEERIAPISRDFLQPRSEYRQLALDGAENEAFDAVRANDTVLRIEIVRPAVFDPEPFAPFNEDARISHNLNQFELRFDETADRGRLIRAAVFDGGKIRRTHVEFLLSSGVSRIEVDASAVNAVSQHATHVAGTMGATGNNLAARGMAPGLRVTSFDWNNDLNNLASRAAEFQVTNHSYGPAAGWTWDSDFGVWRWWGDLTISGNEDIKFGKYDADNQQLDAILVTNPNVATFVAAGNDRNDDPGTQPLLHYVIVRNPATGGFMWQASSAVRNSDNFDHEGLDTIAGLGVSKNCITVGAVHDVLAQNAPINSTEFSSWGPTDDGRIKPDLVANGQVLLSTSSASDNAYVELSGTSMASPTAAGIGARVAEHFRRVRNRFPTSSELKATLIHSATDAGLPGPDPVYGWGSINAEAAGELIASVAGQTIESSEVSAGETKTIELARAADAQTPIRVTVVWADPPASANIGGLDDATLTLQNDIDVKLVAPDGAEHHPYALVRSAPHLEATRSGPNRVDNVEVIDAPAHSGAWKLLIAGANFKSGDEQAYAIVVSGLTVVE